MQEKKSQFKRWYQASWVQIVHDMVYICKLYSNLFFIKYKLLTSFTNIIAHDNLKVDCIGKSDRKMFALSDGPSSFNVYIKRVPR